MKLNSGESQSEPVHNFKQAGGGGRRVVLSSRVTNMSLLLGLVWDLLFHKCNERKHISVTIKLLGLKGITF